MKNLFIITLIILLIAGCKTTKSVLKESVKTDSTVHVDSMSTNLVTHVVSDSVKITDNSVITDKTTGIITQTVFNRPDSTGKQSIESITVTNLTHDKTILTDQKTDIASNQKTDSKSTVEVNKKATLKTDSNNTNKTATSTWVWADFLPLLLPIGIALLIFLFFLLWKIPVVSTFIKHILKIN